MNNDPSGAGDAPLPLKRKEAAEHIFRSTARLTLGDYSGPHTPFSDCLQIIRNAGILAREAIDEEFPLAVDAEDPAARASWFRTIYFLATTGAFPALNQIMVAFSELDRGRQPESLKPSYTGRGSGARTTSLELTIQQQAVEAADRVASFCVKNEERDAVFRSCGTTARTIDRYRDSCEKGWPIYWPRPEAFAELDRGQAEQALREAIQHAKLLQSTRPSKSTRAN